MQKSIFPSEIIGYTAEHILSRFSIKSNIIYCIVICAIIITISSLPFILIPVSIQCNGIIRPLAEKNAVKSLVSGVISNIYVKENQFVKKNQIIMEIDLSTVKEKLNFIRYKLETNKSNLHDLKLLTQLSVSNLSLNTKKLKSMHYKSQYILLLSQIEKNAKEYKNAENELRRTQYLYKEKLVSLSDLEYRRLEVAKFNIHKKLIIEQQLEKWNSDITKHLFNQKQIIAEKEQAESNKKNYTIKSPVSGTVEQFVGMSIGSIIQSAQQVAVISPTKNLILEVHVLPNNIGLIEVGTKAKIQIDAFNYNQWGLATGEIYDIADDFILINNQAIFKVKCKIDQKFLMLKNGYKGYIKKGMSARVRFMITKRTLYQLLFDKIDDWLNPKNISN
jgi:HlyD family secretion protein